MKFFLFILFSTVTIRVDATERFEFFNGVRALGMGGVQISTVNDETALLANPAALGKLRDHFVTVFDPEIDMSQDSYDSFSLDVWSGLQPDNVLTKLNADNSLVISNRLQVFPSLVLPNFGFGALGKYRISGRITGGNYELDYQSDYAAVLGFNFRLFDGRMKLGFNTKVINRSEIKATLPTSTTNISVAANGKEGLGIGMDIGMILTAPWKALPTLSVVARDFGNTSFSSDGIFNTTAQKPDTILQTYDLGVAFFPIMGKKTRTSIALEMRDATNVQGVDDTTKLYHFGMEFNFFDSIFLRLGAHQRYYTAGLEFAVENYQLQFATYGEEVGTAATSEESRRYVVKFAYRF